jgi:hypothetical protein
MKKIVLVVIFGLLVLGAVVAFACDIAKRDRIEAQCLVDRQCGNSNQCKLECLNKANVEAGCR